MAGRPASSTDPPTMTTAPDPYLEAIVRARPGDEVADPNELIRAWLARPSWHRLAACRGVGTEVFFPVLGGNLTRARALCASCEVRSACLAAALALEPATDDGYRGGTTPAERRHLRTLAA